MSSIEHHEPVSREDVERVLWHAEDVPDLASHAAEAVRIINHRTSGGGYVWPADVDAVVGNLQTLAERLPQVLQQAERWLDRALRDGRVGDDRTGARPTVTVENAAAYLLQATVEAGRLADALRTARHHTSHLTGIENA